MTATYSLIKVLKINQYMQHILCNLRHPPTLPLLFVSSCNQASPSISAFPSPSSTSLRVIPSFCVKSSLTCFPHLDLSRTLWCLVFFPSCLKPNAILAQIHISRGTTCDKKKKHVRRIWSTAIQNSIGQHKISADWRKRTSVRRFKCHA